MFKSLLNANGLAVDSLILDLFIILAVVVAGALVIYFLWESINSLITKQHKDVDEMPNFGEKEQEQNEQLVAVNLDEQEKTQEPQEETVLDEAKLTEVDEEKAEEEKKESENEVSEEERLNAERRAYLEARRQELIRRMQAEMVEDESNEEESNEDENEDASVETETEEVKAEEESEAEEQKEETEEVEENTSETEDVQDNLSEERLALAAEKERYAIMVKELEEAKRALEEQNAQAAKETKVSKTAKSALSLEELKARLAEAEQRLEKTEKEFKQCKKEYIPLRRIWTTHDRDEKKLRRKEALVARQKVLLYGVNNFADINEEKAKKLAEDLDHLDGLKLSVQHCEEVMAENAERYPLLEKMYGVLSQRNEELKKDIETYKQEIARLEAESDAE